MPSLLPSMARMNTMWLRDDCSFMAVAPTLRERGRCDVEWYYVAGHAMRAAPATQCNANTAGMDVRRRLH